MRGSGLFLIRNSFGLRILLVVINYKKMVAKEIVKLLNLNRFKSLD
jgi:hypothetical protein